MKATRSAVLGVIIVALSVTASAAAGPGAGTLDPQFGTRGAVLSSLVPGGDAVDLAEDVVIQPDGKIVLAGIANLFDGQGFDFALVRLERHGALDPGFGGGGTLRTDFTGSDGFDVAQGVALQTDGKIVVAGEAGSFSTGGGIGLARYLANGTLDSAFGQGGKV
jgi:uncharacterized delta-60 repeat protein